MRFDVDSLFCGLYILIKSILFSSCKAISFCGLCSILNCTECKDLTSPYLKNLKASNVKDSNEGCTLSLGLIQSLVDAHNQPPEHPFVSGFGQCFNGKISLNSKQINIRSCITNQRNAQIILLQHLAAQL